jgi:acetyltransferase-like isoleucine patch superfamily enzyme
VHVGAHSIVAAGAVVTKDVPNMPSSEAIPPESSVTGPRAHLDFKEECEVYEWTSSGMTRDEILARQIRGMENHLPWMPRRASNHEEQERFKQILKERAGATYFGPNSFVSLDAHIHTDHFAIGANSWVAGETTIRMDVTIGADSSINSYVGIAGRVVIGNNVMIASFASIMGFNHGFERRDVPMHSQPLTIKGITIDDDVWVGTQAVILDGVHVGAHSIIAAGAIVTKDVPEYAIVGGNPARVLRYRP